MESVQISISSTGAVSILVPADDDYKYDDYVVGDQGVFDGEGEGEGEGGEGGE